MPFSARSDSRIDPDFAETSGRTEEDLRSSLFKNMSAIDFDGDGKGGEYGAGYVSLEPLSETPQPFAFGTYRGVFRWYGFALHGTHDEKRIGTMATGGCVNIAEAPLMEILKRVQLGDIVEIREANSPTPVPPPEKTKQPKS